FLDCGCGEKTVSFAEKVRSGWKGLENCCCKAKAPTKAGAFAIRVCKSLNVGAVGDFSLFLWRRSGNLHCHCDIALVTKHPERDRLARLSAGELFAKFRRRVDALAIESGDDVARLQAALFCRRIAVHVANENPLAVRSAKVISELAAQVFGVDAESWLASRQNPVAPSERGNVGNFRHGRNTKSEGLGGNLHQSVVPLFGLAKRCGNGLLLAITPDRKLHRAASRNFMNHPAELHCPFHALTVDFRHDIVFLEPRFRCRTIGKYFANQGAVLVRKLQFFRLLGSHFLRFDAEPAASFAVNSHHLPKRPPFGRFWRLDVEDLAISVHEYLRALRNFRSREFLEFLHFLSGGELRFQLSNFSFQSRNGIVLLRFRRFRNAWQCGEGNAERCGPNDNQKISFGHGVSFLPDLDAAIAKPSRAK